MKTVAKRIVSLYNGQTFSNTVEAEQWLVDTIAFNMQQIVAEATGDLKEDNELLEKTLIASGKCLADDRIEDAKKAIGGTLAIIGLQKMVNERKEN